MIANLNSFIDGPLSRDGNLSLVKQLRNAINKLIKRKNLPEETSYVFGVNPPEPRVPRNIFSPTLSFNQLDEIEIARQLTLTEFNIFSQVVPSEMLNLVWMNADSKHKAPHIMEMSNRFNELIVWVQFNILSIHDNKRNRAAMVIKFIKIAENLKQLKNFQTLFAVLSGLNSPQITRLQQTLLEIPQKTKEILNDMLSIMSKDNSYKAYRELLRTSALPCLPFLDVVLKDVQTLEEQYPDKIGNLVNFQKRQHLFRSITALQNYQQRPYNLQPVHQIEVFLNDFPRKDDKEMMEWSFKCEPKK